MPETGTPISKPAPTMFTVAVYFVNQCYGGPEEGGWWYDAGTLVQEDDDLRRNRIKPIRTFRADQRDEARTYRQELAQRLEETVNKGRPRLSSTQSQGRYQAWIYDDAAPAFFPKERPYYE